MADQKLSLSAPPAKIDVRDKTGSGKRAVIYTRVSTGYHIDTGGPLGRAMVVIVAAIAELEKSLIVERVKAGMRRAKLDGRRIGRCLMLTGLLLCGTALLV